MLKKTRTSMRLHLIIYAAATGLVLGFAASGEAASYTFTKLVDTSGPFLQFGSAAINDGGTVAFSASLDTDGDGMPDASGIFTIDGTTTTTTIADSSGGFSFFSAPSITDGGTVAFSANLSGVSGIFTGSGGPTTTIVDSSGMFSSFNSVSIGNGGAVAFGAGLDVGGSGVFTSDGTSTTTIASSSGAFSFFNLPAMNNGGTVVFVGSLDAGGSGIFAGNGGPTTTIVDSSGPFDVFSFPSSNDVGTVVFWARRDAAGGFGIFTSDGTTVADTAGPFSNFSRPAINDGGTVAFQGFSSGSTGIYIGPDPVADKVIATTNLLDGVAVTGLVFSREGLNDAGQVTFIASLADGTQAIYRADPNGAGGSVPPPDPAPLPDPVPSSDPPSEMEVLIDIKPGNNQNTINLGSQGVVVVAILGSAEFDALTVNPESLELSGAYVKEKGKGTLMARYKDVNGDGYQDLVVHVETQSLSLAESTTTASTTVSTTKAVLTGETWLGRPIRGSDSVNVVP